VSRAACSFLVLAVLLSAARAVATGYNGPTLSGLATNALIQAYGASGLDADTPPPFRLQGYVVTIHTFGDYFKVVFAANTTAEVHVVWIAGRTGSVVRLQPDPVTNPVPAATEGYMLPGIVAGAIIVAYREALREKYLAPKAGAYAANFDAGGGIVSIYFEKTQEPTVVSTVPAPTPTPGTWRCLSGCATGPGYYITMRNGRITIKRMESL
jgi:hypothetical protein